MDWGAPTILVLAVVAAVLTAPMLPSPDAAGTTGYERVDDLRAAGNLLAFKSGCYLLKMVVSERQTAAINAGLSGKEPARPPTHDLLLDAVSASGAELDQVRIHSIQNGTFRADLVLDTLAGTQRVDARPSDATAVAVRANASLLVDADLLRKEGQDLCAGGDGDSL